MANSGLRPDEASRLEFRDVTIVTNEAMNERILEIEVRGKRGEGHCKSMTGSVLPFKRLMARSDAAIHEPDFRKSPARAVQQDIGRVEFEV